MQHYLKKIVTCDKNRLFFNSTCDMGIGISDREMRHCHIIKSTQDMATPLNQHPQSDKVAKTEALDTCLCSRVVCFIIVDMQFVVFYVHIYIVSIIIDHDIYA